MHEEKIVISGGSGFLGRTLIKWYSKRHADIVVLSRQAKNDDFARVHRWDGCTLDTWSEELEGAFALINLAGRSVNCRYHARNRKQMMDSRVLSTRILGEAVRQCKNPPRIWINSSTASNMMRILRDVLGVSIGLPAPRPLLEIGAFFMQTETELIIKSRRVVPQRLLNEGFEFSFPRMKMAIENLENVKANA